MSDKMLDIHGLEHLWQRFLGLFLPRDEAPTKLSEFDNDVGYITEPDMDDATGVLAVEHGGTGSYATRIALDNLKATRHLVINDSEVTCVEDVVTKFENATWNRPVLLSVILGAQVMRYFTNGSITDSFIGTVQMLETRIFDGYRTYFFMFSGRVNSTAQGDYTWGEIDILYDQRVSPQRVTASCYRSTADKGGGQPNVINAISFNGSNVPPDASKRVSLTETDPTVPDWAKAGSKPSYTASEVGAVSTSDVIGIPNGGTGATTEAGARANFFPDDLSNESVAYMAGFTTNWVKGGWLQLPLPRSYGGTGATNAPGARENLGIHSGSAIVYFTNGSATVPFSEFGLNSRPYTLVATLSSRDGFIRYDWDYSASNIVLVCLDSNNTPVTDNVRFSWIAIP